MNNKSDVKAEREQDLSSFDFRKIFGSFTLAIVSVVSYFYAYAFEMGYADYFGFSIEFIELDLTKIFIAFCFVNSLVVILIMMFWLVSRFLYGLVKNILGKLGIKIIATSLFVLAVLLMFPVAKIFEYLPVLFIGAYIIFVLGLLFFLTDVLVLSHFNVTFDIFSFKEKFISVSSLAVSILSLLLFVCYGSGYLYANYNKSSLFYAGNCERVAILRVYGQNMVMAKIDEEGNVMESFTLVKKTAYENEYFKRMNLSEKTKVKDGSCEEETSNTEKSP